MRLQTKIFSLFVTLAVLLAGPLLWTVRQTARQIDMEDLSQRGRTVATDLAEHLAPDFPAAQETRLLPYLQSAQEKTGAVYAAAIGPGGRVLAHTNVTEKGKVYDDANTREDLRLLQPDGHPAIYRNVPIIEVAVPVFSRMATPTSEDFFLRGDREVSRKELLGVIRLGLTLETILQRESRLFNRMVNLLLIGCGAGIFVGFFVMKHLLRPIGWLSTGTARIAQGDYGYEIPIRSSDELGVLTQDFNRMSLSLSETTVSKDFLGNILRHMTDPLIVVDMNHHIQLTNRAALDTLEYTASELEGQSFEKVFLGPLQQKTTDKLLPERLQGAVRNLETEWVTKSGRVLPVLFSSSVMKNKSGQDLGLIAVAKDMTERKRLEGMVRQSDKMSAVGQLAAGVAHEINNPLGVILGFAQSVMKRMPPGYAFELPIRSIEREALRCKNLVQDLLTFSRMSKVEREPMEINKTIEGALSLVDARARTARVEVERRFAAQLPLFLGNVNQIQQIVVNLANNAFDAMSEKGGTLIVETSYLSEPPLNWIVLKVSDTGSGIPAHILPRIFEPFFTTKPIGKGTGLGLSLIHEIVERHSGTIEVESDNTGTRFRIKFPVHEKGAIVCHGS